MNMMMDHICKVYRNTNIELPLLSSYTGTIYDLTTGTSFWFIDGRIKKKKYFFGSNLERTCYYRSYNSGWDQRLPTFEEMYESLNDEQKLIVLWNLDIWKLDSVQGLEPTNVS